MKTTSINGCEQLNLDLQ